MKRITSLILFLIVLSVSAQARYILIDDFNQGEDVNALLLANGAWSANQNDPTQSIECLHTPQENFIGAKGMSLAMTYDVDSPNPAYNGYYFKLGDMDARLYNQIVFAVRGDINYAFPERFNIEIKNRQEVGKYTVHGVSGRWHKFAIPFSDFKGITNWARLTELVIVFSDTDVGVKNGRIYFDDLYFTDGGFSPVVDEELQDIINSAQNEKLEVKVENKAVVITVRVNFDFDKSNIKESEMSKVQSVATILSKYPDLKIDVQGHTDSKGSKKYNQKLSEKRANSVMNALQELGVVNKQITSKGFGKSKPIASNATSEGRYQNRRVEFVVEK